MNIYKLSLFTLLLLSACKNDDKTKEKPAGSGPKDQKPMVVDGIIANEILSTASITTTGTIIANEEVEIKSEVSGKISAIYFSEGNMVSKGQLLVKLQDDDLQAQMRKINLEIKLAEDKENRQKQLLASSATSKEEYDIALANLNILKANADILKTEIDKRKIVAPFGGLLGFKNVSPGAIINSGSIITTIQNIQPLKLEFSVPEKYNPLIQKGKTIDFTVADSGQKYTAQVYAKDPKIDPATRTSRIRASFPNPGNRLFPGSFAEINISIGEKVKVKMVPTMAYIPDINGAKLLIKKGGVVQSVPVKSGLRTEKEIQILDGLSEGDTVITSGILQLKPNMPVQVNIINPSK